jgi:type VI secretion system protein ImpI
MYLTFEVISANAAALGNGRRKVFTVDGGRIGRSSENEMVLPGVGVHRHHATVRFINGVFFVEGVGTNGIAINDPERVLPRNEPYPLKSGDKVFIDEYEVLVSASAAAPAEPAARAAARDVLPPAAAEPTGGNGPRGGSLVGSPGESAEDLDPLRNLTGAAAPASRPQRPQAESSWNHSSSLADHFTPPPVVGAAPTAASSPNVIPENWDRTSFDRSKLQPAATPIPAPPAHGTQGSHAVPPSYGAQPPPAAPSSYGVQPPHAAPASYPAPSAHAAHAAARLTPVTRAAFPPQPPVTNPGAHTGRALFDWEGFLRSTGVDPSRVPPETAAVLGNILRSVVQGLIEVLRARSEIKTEFRMPVTQVKVSENNPLKFAANAEDALGNLLGRRNPAYLAPQEAFDDALNDVRFHQLAMLAGVRAGFDNLIDRFDPAQLQEAFERQGKRGGLFGGSKVTYWERYTERYEEMTKDRDDTFRRLFGEEFARAYEQQLSVLKRGRGGTP